MPGTGGGGVLGDRLNTVFGPLSSGINPLQNSAANSANRMLTQQSPEQRALEASQPFLNQTGLNPGATNRLQQGATQSGLNPGSNNFYSQLLGGQPNLGPGGDVESILGAIGQSGGFGGGPGSILQSLSQLGAGQGMGGGASGNEGFLQSLMAQNPAIANQALLQPQFERSLQMANQQGGRFGSANALLRSNAVTDQQAQLAQMLGQGTNQQLQGAGLLGQQAQANRALTLQSQLQALGLGGNLMQNQVANRLGAAGQLGGFRQQGATAGLQAQLQGAGAQQGFNLQDIGQQLAAAGQLGNQGLQGQQNILQGQQLGGQLAGQAGNAERANVGQAFGIGQGIAGQQDLDNQRRIQLIMGLLGQAQGATFNQPTQVTPSGAQQGAQIGGGIANTIAAFAPFLGGGGGRQPGQQFNLPWGSAAPGG